MSRPSFNSFYDADPYHVKSFLCTPVSYFTSVLTDYKGRPLSTASCQIDDPCKRDDIDFVDTCIESKLAVGYKANGVVLSMSSLEVADCFESVPLSNPSNSNENGK